MKRKLSDFQENIQKRHDHHQPTPTLPLPQPQQDREATLDPNISPSQGVGPSHATPRISPRTQEMYQQPSNAFPPTTALPTSRFSGTSGSAPMPLPLIDAPYPWATTGRAALHPIGYLLLQNINTIEGSMQCKHCREKYEMRYDLQEKFMEVSNFIIANKYTTSGMAPYLWEHPRLLDCISCLKYENVMPIIEMKKRDINWLFLFLGQWIGCCSLEQLKYFCKHNGYDQQGSKAHLVYRTHIGLYEQLLPQIR